MNNVIPGAPWISTDALIQPDTEKDFYPCTVFLARYNGVYEGGTWVAFAMEPHEIPVCATGREPDAAVFWDKHARRYNIGRGDTPDAAIVDLVGRLRKLR